MDLSQLPRCHRGWQRQPQRERRRVLRRRHTLRAPVIQNKRNLVRKTFVTPHGDPEISWLSGRYGLPVLRVREQTELPRHAAWITQRWRNHWLAWVDTVFFQQHWRPTNEVVARRIVWVMRRRARQVDDPP